VELVRKTHAHVAAAIELFPAGHHGDILYHLNEGGLEGYTQVDGVCHHGPFADQISMVLDPTWFVNASTSGCLGAVDSRAYVAARVSPPLSFGNCQTLCVVAVHMPHGPATSSAGEQLKEFCGQTEQPDCVVAFGDWNGRYGLDPQWRSTRLFDDRNPTLSTPSLSSGSAGRYDETCCYTTANVAIDHLVTNIPNVERETQILPYRETQILDQNPVEAHHPMLVRLSVPLPATDAVVTEWT